MRLIAKLPPGSWAVAMGCGIVSIDLNTIGQRVLSAALNAIAAAVWLLLIVRLASFPALAVSESASPPILGSVAATAVLGARLAPAGARVAAAALLVLAAAVINWRVGGEFPQHGKLSA